MNDETAVTGVLHPGTGPIHAEIYLPSDPDAIFWGRLPRGDDPPVLAVDDGAVVTVDTLSHEGVLEDQGSDPVAFFGAHGVPPEAVLADAVRVAEIRHRDEGAGPHIVTGPIEIRGTQPGDLLAIDVLETLPRVPYGVISNRHGRGALPGELPRTEGAVSVFAGTEAGPHGPIGRIARSAEGPRDVTFPLAPFLGLMGVASTSRERLDSVPPGPHGGNLDIKLLTAGSTLYLPVQVPGALAYLGDPHFAQGDGEVALTALEASLRVTVRFRRIPASEPIARVAAVHGPIVQTPEYLVPTGLDPDLGEAMRKAVRAAIAVLVELFGMDHEHAYAYLSAATDFDISQVVDQVTGVHARIRVADLTGGPA
ncbi:MAG: acetamidase/formamidase family protein [Actinomycetales bacterium]|nr:acetamidase/formamidase family protein [Actinomycetales bacterium]